jgi:Peptidase family M1 domain
MNRTTTRGFMRPGLTCLVLTLTPCAGGGQVTDTGQGGVVPAYRLDLRLDPDARQLRVSGTIQLPATAETGAPIVLVLSHHMQGFRVSVVEPRASAGAATISAADTTAPAVRWIIHPRRSIAPHTRILLRFDYESRDTLGFVYAVSPVISFAGGSTTAWYPQLEGEGDRGLGVLTFNVPIDYVVIASGDSTSTHSDRTRRTFGFTARQPSYFSFAAARYAVRKRSTGTVPIAAYRLRERSDGEHQLDQWSSILAVLVLEFGPHPYRHLTIAEVPSTLANAAGFQGASAEGMVFVSSDFLSHPIDIAYFGHELSHQWWGVAIRQAGDSGDHLLSEGMAQYGALRVVEALEGAVAGEAMRRDGFGGGALGYFESVAAGGDAPLIRVSGDASQSLAWTKGYQVLDLLARMVGRDRFRRTLLELAGQHAFGVLTWSGFWRAIQQRSGGDLTWFGEQWLERTGAPEWSVEWSQKGESLLVTVRQQPPAYRASVTVRVDGLDYEALEFQDVVADSVTRLRRVAKFRVRSVELDPHFEVLHWTPGYRADAAAMGPYLQADRLREQRELVAAESLLAAWRVPDSDLSGACFLKELGLARLAGDRRNIEGARQHLDGSLACPVRPARMLPWAYFGYAFLAQATKNDSLLRWAVGAVRAADAAAGGHTGAPEAVERLLSQ